MNPPRPRRDQLHVAPRYQPIFRELGIDAAAVFEHPQIKPWRTLADRENCTLDAALADGTAIRWHIKRYAAAKSAEAKTAADDEVRGLNLLIDHDIPTVDMIAWGRLADGRSFIILDDLGGHDPADKLIERGLPFDRLLEATAQLAARLHDAGLHHRDLYLCHFFASVMADRVEVRLIDAARVRPLPRFLRNRWVTKDLAQFWYSTLRLPIDDDQRQAWLARYASARGINAHGLRRAIERKVRWIARHDERLRRREPTRNVSIPAHVSRLPDPSSAARGGYPP